MSIQPVSTGSNTPTSIVLETALNHYSGTEDVNWHVQLEISRATDPTNASPVVQKDSDSDNTGFYWRDDQTNASDRGLTQVPASPSGMATKLSKAQPHSGMFPPGHVGTVFYYLTTSEIANFTRGEEVFVHSRQSADNGSSWGDWTSRKVVVGGSR